VPRQNVHRLMRNGNRTVIMPLLDDIKELKQSYKSAKAASASLDRCDELIRTILGLLKRQGVRDALDTLLADENGRNRPSLTIKISAPDLKDEIELAGDFGYSASEVKQYVKRARRELAPGTHHEIADIEDLMRELREINARFTQGAEAAGSRFARWRTIRRAREDAQYQLYCVGTIIADGMTKYLFETSYTVGTSGLAKAAGND